MNSSTASDQVSTTKENRQSNYTLAFFCFAIILIALSSCTQGIFETPYGNRTLLIDTLSYDQSIMTSIKNIPADASGNDLLQNKVGEYLDLETDFLIKFTNFSALTTLPDSLELIINEANVVLYSADHWGDAQTISIDINMVDPDSSLYWVNTDDFKETFESIEGRTTYNSSVNFDIDADSIFIPIDLATINDWYDYPDSFYVNTGFTVTPSVGSDGIIAFYSADYAGDYSPRLKVSCTINDTNGVYLQDSVFTVYANGDMQRAVNNRTLNDGLFYMSQGNIDRTYIVLDSLRNDTLLSSSYLINHANLKLVMNDSLSSIGENDTLAIGAKLFRTDYWESDSISYLYKLSSNEITSLNDTITINIAQLIQYLISNPKEMEYEGIYFYLNNEYYDFNQVLIDPKDISLDIIYTKVNNE